MMKIEELFNKSNIIDLSFFNFRNAITAAYFANSSLEIMKVNENFRKFFPVLGNVTNAYFPDVLEQLGVPGAQIDDFVTGIKDRGSVLIPQIQITIDGTPHMYSLLSTTTTDESFSYLEGVQGQFVDRTAEWQLRKEREELLEQKIRDQEIIEEKSRQLEDLATRLAKYLSPQIYESIFSGKQDDVSATRRKNLTVFFSDIEAFAELSDSLDPESVAKVINSYLSEMSAIAIECGGTIDKFIGDAILIFFGDPETKGEQEDALRCVEMALRMQQRVEELQNSWQRQGASRGLKVRIAIATGYCTVGNFGSEQRLEYTVLGGPVNLAARLQLQGPPGRVLVAESTYNLIKDHVDCDHFGESTPKGFARPVQVFQVKDFISSEHRERRRRLSRIGNHVEVNVIDSSDIRAAIEELRRIQGEFEQQFKDR
jgi:class 3 adenylate cyclase